MAVAPAATATPAPVQRTWLGIAATTPAPTPTATSAVPTATLSPAALSPAAPPRATSTSAGKPSATRTPSTPVATPVAPGTPAPTALPTPVPTPTPAPQPGRVSISISTADASPSWSVSGASLPWTTSLQTRDAFEGSVHTDSSSYWSTLTFCYSIMPTDNGALAGIEGDGCSVGPNGGGDLSTGVTPPTQDAPTWVIWTWTCSGTSPSALSSCATYGRGQGWILPGSF